MRIENIEATTFTIFDAPRLDPVTVVLQDMGGCGRLIVECFGCAWSGYWGAIGNETLKDFLIGCDPEYISGKMEPNDRRMKKGERAYFLRIVQAVHSALTPNVQIEGQPASGLSRSNAGLG